MWKFASTLLGDMSCRRVNYTLGAQNNHATVHNLILIKKTYCCYQPKGVHENCFYNFPKSIENLKNAVSTPNDFLDSLHILCKSSPFKHTRELTYQALSWPRQCRFLPAWVSKPFRGKSTNQMKKSRLSSWWLQDLTATTVFTTTTTASE